MARGRHRSEDAPAQAPEPLRVGGAEGDDDLEHTAIRPRRGSGDSTLLALAVHAIGEELDVGGILHRTVELSCAVTGAEHAMLGVSGKDGDLDEMVTHGDPGELDRGHTLALPLVVDGRLFGTLHLGGRVEPFVGYDTQRVSLLLRAAGTAIGHLHDRERYADERVAEERDRLAGVLRELDQTAREIVEQGTGALGFAPRLRLTGTVALLPDELREELLSALGEALQGLSRQQGSRRVEVEVDASPQWAMLTITDDGARTGRAGLDELEARARRLGGALRLQPVVPAGSRLSWIVPVG